MKQTRLLLALLLTLGCSTGARATATGDTLVVEQAERVRIETRDTVQRIVISGMKDDPEFHYVQRIAIPDTSAVRRRFTRIGDFNKVVIAPREGKEKTLMISPHLYFGLGTMTGAPDGYSLFPSFEFGVGFTADWHPFGRKNMWSAGLMFAVNSYNHSSDRYWTTDADGVLQLVPFSDDQSHTNGSLSMARLQLPLAYTHRFGSQNRWRLTLGAMLNWNFALSASRSYKYQDESYSVSSNFSGCRPLTVDPFVVFDAPYLPAIYCRYSPMTFFRDGRGPAMHELHFGLLF